MDIVITPVTSLDLTNSTVVIDLTDTDNTEHAQLVRAGVRELKPEIVCVQAGSISPQSQPLVVS